MTFFSEEKKAKDFLKGQGSKKARTQKLLPQKPPGTARAAFSFCAMQRVHILPRIEKRPIRPGRFSGCAAFFVGREPPRVFSRAASITAAGRRRAASITAAGRQPRSTKNLPPARGAPHRVFPEGSGRKQKNRKLFKESLRKTKDFSQNLQNPIFSAMLDL